MSDVPLRAEDGYWAVGTLDAPAHGRSSARSSEHGGCRKPPIIFPESSAWLTVWDLWMAFLLLVVVILAPFETAFLEPRLNTLFLVNRVMDVCFCIDMGLQFFTATSDPHNPSVQVKDLRSIAKLYLSGWFWIDLVSVVPVDLYCLKAGRAGSLTRLRDMKAMRLLRLAKLLRLARVQRILERWHTSLGVNYSWISLAQWIGSVFITCHWMSCLWAGVAMQADSDHTWLRALQVSKGGPDELYTDDFDVYCISLYWAIMTITSIGYGDITAQNRTEYIAAAVCMSCMAGIWAYVIGAVCGIVATLQPHEIHFKQTMDDLNNMMDECSMPAEMRRRLRRYFHEARTVNRSRIERRIIDQMSPLLQGEVSLFLHQQYVSKVPYLADLNRDAMVYVARTLTMMVYPPAEDVSRPRTLCIVEQGICMKNGMVLVRGGTWGHDMLLSNPLLLETPKVRSLSYLHLVMLHGSDVASMVSKFPEVGPHLARVKMKFAVRRGILLIARCLTQAHGDTSFVDLCGRLDDEHRSAIYVDILKGRFSAKKLNAFVARTGAPHPGPKEPTIECALRMLTDLSSGMQDLAAKVGELTLAQAELQALVEATQN